MKIKVSTACAAIYFSALSAIACGSSDDGGNNGRARSGNGGNAGTAVAGTANAGKAGATGGSAGTSMAGSAGSGISGSGGAGGSASGGAAGSGGTAGSGGASGDGGASGASGSGGASGASGSGGASGASGSGGASGASGSGSSGSAGSGGSGGSTGHVSVYTRSYDNQRTGANLAETELNTSNVNGNQFGKLFELPVDDQVYTQILYVSDVSIAGGKHNVIYVSTVNNTVYAFDADAPGTPLWSRNFNGTGRATTRAEVGQNCGTYNDFSGNIGIIGTPVIDPGTGAMYFVTRTVEATKTVQRLQAIDISTGNDVHAPTVIQASVPGTGAGSVAGSIAFDPVVQNQRMSLSLSNGVVYAGWSAFCDTGKYHGWILAYDATTLSQVGAFNTTPGGNQAGIWQGGAAAAFDPAGNLYAMTGNGSFDGVTNFGESVVKLKPSALNMTDFFTPANYDSLNGQDWDLGSAGPSWLSGPGLLVGGGKEGKLYLMDPANLGHTAAGDTQVLQSFQAVDPTARPGATHHIHNTVAVWDSPQGLNVYLQGENDYLRGFRYNPGTKKFLLPATLVSTVLPPLGMPGGMLTVSANGAQAGTGILWAITPRLGDANRAVVPGVLRAYNAETLALLWESTKPADGTLDFAKFSNPTVANGKVYATSFSRAVSVYGLRPTPPPNLALNKATTSSAPCQAAESSDKATNGSVILGNTDKWCSGAATKFLQVDLGASVDIATIVIRHANAGGEDFAFNTRDFTVQVSTNGTDYTTVANVTGNVASQTTHTFATTPARYVRLNVTTPTQTADGAARIYEVEVYAP